MNWLQKAVEWVRTLSIRESQHWRHADTDVASGEAVNETSVLALSAAWGCVNLLAGTIASLPLMVYRTDRNGNRTVAADHPLYRILHDSPNFDQTAVDFWEFMTASIELRGNAVARVDRAAGLVSALTPIGVPVDVRRVSNGDLYYRWTEDGQSFDLPQTDVFHVRGFGGSPLGGLSTLSYGRQVFGLAGAINKSAGAMFRNGMRPAVNLTFDKFLTDEQRERVKNTIATEYAGAMNDGKPFISEGGMKLETISINPEDAQMLESRGFSVEEVCRFFGVPPFMVGHTEKSSSWGTGLEQQTLGFQKFTLRRRLKRIEQAAEKQLLTPADRVAGITIEFNLEGLLRGDSTARAAFYQSGLANGWMTINEVRSLENLPPVEGGGVPRMQMQNVPITQTVQPTALAAPADE